MSRLEDADTLRMPPVRPRTAAYADAQGPWTAPAPPSVAGSGAGPGPGIAGGLGAVPGPPGASAEGLDHPFFRNTPLATSIVDDLPLNVPRPRGRQVALVAVTMLVAGAAGAGFAGWKNGYWLRGSAPVAPAVQPRPAETASPPTPARARAPVPAPAVGGQRPRPGAASDAKGDPRVGTVTPPEVKAEPRLRPRRPEPLRNMVWSDRLQRLVPADGAEPPVPEATTPGEPPAPSPAEPPAPGTTPVAPPAP
jgi:hypothetical protein